MLNVKIFSLYLLFFGMNLLYSDEGQLKFYLEKLQEEPGNSTYLLKCAQEYKDQQQYGEAIRLFKAYVDIGEGLEEVWHSKYMIGECYEALGYWKHALEQYLEAFEHNPQRAETLQKIATHYRLGGLPNLSFLFASHGKKIPYPKDQSLSIREETYAYQFDEELSITGFYTQFKEEGYAALNRLILKKGIPYTVKENAFRNLLFYVKNIKSSGLKPIEIDLPLISEKMKERYRPMNPSLQKTETGYSLICRTVNWTQEGGKNYRSLDPEDPTIRTKNFLIEYDREFNVLSQKEIIENLPRERAPSRIQGLEDCRLINFENNSWLIAVSYDIVPGAVSQVLCHFVNDPDKNCVSIDKMVHLKGANPSCEKNWLPFRQGNDIYAIYYYDPFVVYKLNRETGECETVIRYETDFDFSHFRGSATPIAFDEGYLLLVHEVTFTEVRNYTHRFVYLDKNFAIKKVSYPFTFFHKGIEYCSGLTMDHLGKECILSIGVEDRMAVLLTIDLPTLRSMLFPL